MKATKLHKLLLEFYHQSRQRYQDLGELEALANDIDYQINQYKTVSRLANKAARRRNHVRAMLGMGWNEVAAYMAIQRPRLYWASVKRWKEWDVLHIERPRVRLAKRDEVPRGVDGIFVSKGKPREMP